jgi:hypothetical protein
MRCGTLANASPNTGPVGSGRYLLAGPFLVYKVQSIFNTGSAARSFYFNSGHLFLTEDPRVGRHVGPSSPPPEDFLVAAGTTWTSGGRVIFKVDHYPSRTTLEYHGDPSDPPVLLIAGSQGGALADVCRVDELPTPAL